MHRYMRIGVMAMALVSLLAACRKDDLPYALNDLPDGDAARGAILFAQSIDGAPACSACHSIDGKASSGPTLENFGTVAGTRVGGQSAETYAFNSILRPAKHLVRGYSNVMYRDYADRLSQQDTADLIAYILSL